MVIDYSKKENDQNMLPNLYKEKWFEQLNMKSVKQSAQDNMTYFDRIKELSGKQVDYIKSQNSNT